MSATLVYWRYRARFEEEFDTVDDAIDVAAYLHEYGEGWVEEIVGPNGSLTGDELLEKTDKRANKLFYTEEQRQKYGLETY